MRFSTGWREHELFVTLMSSRTYSTFLSDLFFFFFLLAFGSLLKGPCWSVFSWRLQVNLLHNFGVLCEALFSLIFCLVKSSLSSPNTQFWLPNSGRPLTVLQPRNSLGSKPGQLITFSQWSMSCIVYWPIFENHFSHIFIQCFSCLRWVLVSWDWGNNHHKLGGWKQQQFIFTQSGGQKFKK